MVSVSSVRRSEQDDKKAILEMTDMTKMKILVIVFLVIFLIY